MEDTLIIVGTKDPLLNANKKAEAVIKNKLKKPATLFVIENTFHGFQGLPPQWRFFSEVKKEKRKKERIKGNNFLYIYIKYGKKDTLPATFAMINFFNENEKKVFNVEEKLPIDYSFFVVFSTFFFLLLVFFRTLLFYLF